MGEAQKNVLFLVSNIIGDTIIHSEKSYYARSKDLAASVQNDQRWCQVVLQTCSIWGTADAGSLEHYDPNKPIDFELDLNEERWATAELFEDSFTIGGKVIPKVPFGIPSSSNLDTNILGLGFEDNEAVGNKYLNLPQVIKENKFTKINAYSFWANKNQGDGQIVFGGYDRAKYTGNLAHLKVQTINGRFKEPFVPVKGASFGKTKKTLFATALNAAVLDISSSITYLPRDFAETVGKAVGATKDDDQQFVIDCTLSDELAQMYMVVNFGAVKIKLLAKDLVSSNLVIGAPAGKCFWGVFPTDDRAVLGSNILRGAYVVFDLDHKIVSIAQIAQTSDSRGYEIPEGGLQTLGNELGLGEPDPELERVAGNTESGDEGAENSNTDLGNANNGALNTAMGPGTNLPSNAAGTESTNFDGSNDQNANYFLPTTNAFLGTLGTGTQRDKPLAQMTNDASTFNSDGSGKLTAKLSSDFSGTEPSAENGITTQQQPAGEYALTTANAPTLGINQDSSTTMTKNNNDNNGNFNAWHYSATSNLFPTYSLTPAGSGSGVPPTTNSNQASFPVAAGTSLSDNKQDFGVNLASSFTPGGGAGENMFLDTNPA